MPALQLVICWSQILVTASLTNIAADNEVSASALFKFPSSFSLPETPITYKPVLISAEISVWVSTQHVEVCYRHTHSKEARKR